MRQSPGGHNPQNHSGNAGKNELWNNTQYQQRLTNLWRNIAQIYVNESIIAGYDLLNEPLAPNSTILNTVYKDITQTIREVDYKHIIFLEGNNWTKNMDWIDNPIDNNTALSFHFYEPGFYATEGQGTYPSIVQRQLFDKNAIRIRLQERLSYIRSINKPVFIGEFGAMTSAGNYLNYDNDVIDLFEEENLNWIYWNYKNLKGRNDTQAIYYTDSSNLFLSLINEIDNGSLISDFTQTEINNALDSLITLKFEQKSDLRYLLINCFK